MKVIYRNAYLYLSILFLLTIFAFWPVYFARLTDAAPLIHAHTIFGMIWLGLMINQTRLVRNKRIKEHRNLGKLSYLIVPPFLLTSLIIFRTFLDMDTEFEQMLALQITFYDLSGVLLFSVAFTLALTKYKKDMQMHARLMIATLTFLLFPVVSRIFLFYASLGMGPVDVLLTGIYATEALFLILIFHDWRTGKIYPVYPAVAVVVGAQHVGFLYSNEWQWWVTFASFYGGVS